jgi:chromate transporter
MTSAVETTEPVETIVDVDRWRFFLYFLKLGAAGFGGPIALAGFMQRDLVEQRRWISRQDYLDGLALAQLAPGPLAAQLAIYLGYVRAGTLGASIVAVLFVLPSFLMVWAISYAYVRFGGLPWMAALFYGIGAAVIGIIARSVQKLTKMTLSGNRLLWGICLVSAAVTAWTEREIVWLFAFAGIATVVIARRHVPAQSAGVFALLAPGFGGSASLTPSLTGIFYMFAKAGAFVFGSGLAIVPFLYGELVQTNHWLNDRQFLDAVAVAMITPGPVVITVAFVGYLVSGASGMTVASLGVFLPVYLFVVIPAPYFRRHRSQPDVKAFVDGVSAAATGAIAGAAFVLAKRALIDPWTIGICVLAFVVLWRWKVSELWVIGVAAVVGLALNGIVFAQAPVASAPGAPLRVVATIPLPNVRGRIDHLAFDAARQRLFVAALGNDTVEVIDIAKASHLRTLTGFHEPQGIAIAAAVNGVAVANGDTGTLQLIDAESFQTRWTTRIGGDADNVRYDVASNRLFVAAEGGVTAVDPGSGKVLQQIAIDGHPESFQLEAGSSRLFANLPGSSRIIVADRATGTVTAMWPTAACGSNYPMALDESTMRVFVGCRSPASVTSFDASSGKPIVSSSSVGDTDDLFYDTVRKRLYVIGGEGFVDVIERDGDRLRSVAHVPTRAGARTGLWVAAERRLYVATPARGANAAEVVVFEAAN